MHIEASLIDPLTARLVPRPLVSGSPGVRATTSLRIGLLVPQSGPMGILGPSAVEAALLAAHEYNLVGGVQGRQVELVLVDSGRRPASVATEVLALAAEGAVDALVGFHTSDVHQQVLRALADPALPRRIDYVFTPPHEGGRLRSGEHRLGPGPARQLGAALPWVIRRHRTRRWALVGTDYVWPQAVHRVARPLLHRAGVDVVLDLLVPVGQVPQHCARIADLLRQSRADAVLLSVVGSDLAAVNLALRREGLHRRLVRLSFALEENALMACDGDDTGLLYAAMPSFTTLTDDRSLARVESHRALFGPHAPVLDTYSHSLYEGIRSVCDGLAAPVPAPAPVHLARAQGLQFEVVHTCR